MAKKFRVIAHGMHEYEIAFAANNVEPGSVATEAYVVGTASETQIAALREKGLIVEEVGELEDGGALKRALRAETPGVGTMAFAGKSRALNRMRPIKPVDTLPDLMRPKFFLIEINGPLLPNYVQQLEAINVRLLESFRNNFYTAQLETDQIDSVRELPFVLGAELYSATDTAPSRSDGVISMAVAPPRNGARQMKTYDLKLHREEDLDDVKDWLNKHNVAIAGTSRRKLRIHVFEDAPELDELAALPEVQSMGEYVRPKLFNDRACTLMNTGAITAAPLSLDGASQIVAVADTGIDDGHPDFAGRVVAKIGLGRPNDSSDPDGHGTHVAGSILGSGAASNGSIKGVAPAAKLYFQSVMDASGELEGLPLDLNDLFEPAYQAGARIHNNSWGSDTQSIYTLNSSDVDEYVSRRRDMLVVVAAGNEGTGKANKNAPKGMVDWLSIGAPATAKNALTVGASCSDRAAGGYQLTWTEAWGSDFPHPPVSDQRVSGDANTLAAFSSRGPSDDRRIKPDIVAPGTNILSTKSRSAPVRNFWGGHNNHYAYMGGTSMATPLVAGCAALVRQYYEEKKTHKPSAALIRATLINGTRWLAGADANASNPAGAVPAGNFDQGFGCIDLSASIPNGANSGLALTYVDNWSKPAEHFVRSGQKHRYEIEVEGGAMLRICLAYTDAPGRGLQNNLNLFVQLPDNSKLIGNQQLRHGLNIPDVDNNVEIVRIANPAPGPYLIQISATNLLHQGQDFALVAFGKIKNGKITKL